MVPAHDCFVRGILMHRIADFPITGPNMRVVILFPPIVGHGADNYCCLLRFKAERSGSYVLSQPS